LSANIVAFLYLVSGVCFILALRGLSNPESARLGNIFGISGMAIAVLTTLTISVTTNILDGMLIISGITIGGGVGIYCP
jgi:H+-translocating NAD(P) transhydrogenase subunit beta